MRYFRSDGPGVTRHVRAFDENGAPSDLQASIVVIENVIVDDEDGYPEGLIVMIATQLYDQVLRRFAVTALIKIVQVPTGRRKRATSTVMAFALEGDCDDTNRRVFRGRLSAAMAAMTTALMVWTKATRSVPSARWV